MIEENSIVEIDGGEIRDILESAVVMPPVTVIGVHVKYGVNPNLVIEDEVATIELLCLTPSPEGDRAAVFTLIMDPELAEAVGLTDIDPEEETTDEPE